MGTLVSDLQALIRQPSVSAKKVGLVECASLVAGTMKNAGIKSEVLYLDDKGIPPIVYGEVKSRSNPNRTILFYNHYDVQPEEPKSGGIFLEKNRRRAMQRQVHGGRRGGNRERARRAVP
jgi:acetylornithine deacetylase/succinyl-diaminopimelate desuccinylase-like protein